MDNGDRYYGNWKNGKTHGKGTKLWSEGREYVGMFKNDKLHGEGSLYYPDGKKYEGEFPKKYFKEFLDYLNITEKHFWKVVNSWRSKHLWKKINNRITKLSKTKHAIY